MGKRCLEKLAVDVGTSSVRTFLAKFDGEKIYLSEEDRFYHRSVQIPGREYWNVLGVYERLEQAIAKASGGREISSISLDSWGTDMAAIDRRGELLTQGICTRDRRFEGLKERVFRFLAPEEIYSRTGIQFLDWNTLYLLYDWAINNPRFLESVDKFLFIPDLLLYFLTGEKNCDYTIASTSQMLNPYTGGWDTELLKILGIPAEKLLPVNKGKYLGRIRKRVLLKEIPVYSGCSHDTAAAVAGIPLGGSGEMYLICGSWVMAGIELKTPVITDESFRYGFTNEGGIEGGVRFLKNIMGMWLIQETRRQWEREGAKYTFEQLAKLAAEAECKSVIPIDDPSLRKEGDIPRRIRELCKTYGQQIPETQGEVILCIYNSLAYRIQCVRKELEICSRKVISKIRIAAGGSQDSTLCQIIADVTGCVVESGPVEASIYGNAAVQLILSGELRDLDQAREVIKNSVSAVRYEPI